MTNGTTTDVREKNRISMIRLQKDIDELFAGRKSLVRSGNQTKTLSSIYQIRPLEEHAEPLLFLLHAPKKFFKHAHVRNKLKRWMREAIRQSEELHETIIILSEKKMQAMVLLRADFAPSQDHAWEEIKSDIAVIARLFSAKIQNSKLKT